MTKIQKITHLGDGAYAGTDGYHIWLGANHHENMTVALEPPVFAALVKFAQEVMGWEIAHSLDTRGLELDLPKRTEEEMLALAAWLNVSVDQIPPENRTHTDPQSMAGWKRVTETLKAFYRKD